MTNITNYEFDPLGDGISRLVLLDTMPTLQYKFYENDDPNNLFSSLDLEVAIAARASFGKGLRTPEKDKKLIQSIVERKHTSCLEQIEYKFFVKCPIFVSRQWMRHRTWSYNEISRRYTEENIEFYFPNSLRLQDKNDKQMSSEEKFEDEHMEGALINLFKHQAQTGFERYEFLLKKGVVREQARMILPQNLYTQFIAKTDLNNLLKFIDARADKHAQEEIRVYAEVMRDEILPVTNPIVFEKYMEMKK